MLATITSSSTKAKRNTAPRRPGCSMPRNSATIWRTMLKRGSGAGSSASVPAISGRSARISSRAVLAAFRWTDVAMVSRSARPASSCTPAVASAVGGVSPSAGAVPPAPMRASGRTFVSASCPSPRAGDRRERDPGQFIRHPACVRRPSWPAAPADPCPIMHEPARRSENRDPTGLSHRIRAGTHGAATPRKSSGRRAMPFSGPGPCLS